MNNNVTAILNEIKRLYSIEEEAHNKLLKSFEKLQEVCEHRAQQGRYKTCDLYCKNDTRVCTVSNCQLLVEALKTRNTIYVRGRQRQL